MQQAIDYRKSTALCKNKKMSKDGATLWVQNEANPVLASIVATEM